GLWETVVGQGYAGGRRIALLHPGGEWGERGGDDADQRFAPYPGVLQEDPAGDDPRTRLERLARVMDKWPDLVKLLDNVVRTVPDEELKIALLLRMAHYHEAELGEDDQAVATYERVLDVDGKHLLAASAIQTIHERNGDYAHLV